MKKILNSVVLLFVLGLFAFRYPCYAEETNRIVNGTCGEEVFQIKPKLFPKLFCI